MVVAHGQRGQDQGLFGTQGRLTVFCLYPRYRLRRGRRAGRFQPEWSGSIPMPLVKGGRPGKNRATVTEKSKGLPGVQLERLSRHSGSCRQRSERVARTCFLWVSPVCSICRQITGSECVLPLLGPSSLDNLIQSC